MADPSPSPSYLNCFSKTTGAACPGYPTYVSLDNGGLRIAFGVGADNFATARQNQGYLDRTTGRYYVAGASISDNSLGVLCIDLVAQKGCGWLPLQPGYGSNGVGHVDLPVRRERCLRQRRVLRADPLRAHHLCRDRLDDRLSRAGVGT